jgi:hypothetical protein
MHSGDPSRILIVANRTAATPALLAQVQSRAEQGPCRFTLLVPRLYWDADTEEGSIPLEPAIPLLEDAAGGHAEGLIGDTDPIVAVCDTLEHESFDEVIVSTLPERVSRWLRRDLPLRVNLELASVHASTDRGVGGVARALPSATLRARNPRAEMCKRPPAWHTKPGPAGASAGRIQARRTGRPELPRVDRTALASGSRYERRNDGRATETRANTA